MGPEARMKPNPQGKRTKPFPVAMTTNNYYPVRLEVTRIHQAASFYKPLERWYALPLTLACAKLTENAN